LCSSYNIFVWFCFTKKIWNIICHNLSISTILWLWFYRCWLSYIRAHSFFHGNHNTVEIDFCISLNNNDVSFAINELTVYCHTVFFTVFFEGSSEGHALRHSYFIKTRIVSRPGFMAARWCKTKSCIIYVFQQAHMFASYNNLQWYM
jgi:hypothetical protein